MEFFERTSVTLKEGTTKLIKGYVENHPYMFDNKSHFVRCAVERQLRHLRNKGKFAHKRGEE